MSRYGFPDDYVANSADQDVARQLNRGAGTTGVSGYSFLTSCASRAEAERVNVRQADNGPSGAIIAMAYDLVDDAWLVFARTTRLT